MAIKTLDSAPESTPSKLTFDASSGDRIQLPSEGFVTDATMTRDGDDLLLKAPSGETATIKDYYSVEEAPLLQSPNGATLTPQLVESFTASSLEYAAGNTANDESPVGAAEEVKGSATVTRTDGTVETITIGTPIYQGDIVQTEADGAVNIRFVDETSMAVSQNARLSIDNYSFDPKTESGETDFSVLRGLFVFTSGLIGRDDPDDVHINTPVGSIGIRGTIIAGEINPTGESKITVLEGAIVVTNTQSETTLSQQFETVHLRGLDTPMQEMGVVPAADINARFESISYVVPTLFSTIEDSVKEQTNTEPNASDAPVETKSEEPAQEAEPQSQDPVQTEPAVPQVEQPMLQEQSRMDIIDPELPTSDIINLGDTTGLRLTDSGTSGTVETVTVSSTTRTASSSTTTISIDGSYRDSTLPPPTVLNRPAERGDTTTTAPVNTTLNLNNLAAPGVTVIDDDLMNHVGYSITALGDMNNDGFDDIGFTNSTVGQNHVYILYGSAGTLADSSVIDLVTSSRLATQSFAGLNGGNTVISGVGDYNGDGQRDYAIGQSDATVSGYISGGALIIDPANPSTNNVAFSGGTGSAGAGFGSDVTGIGDYNNDGYTDVIVSAPDYNTGTGRALLVYGANNWNVDPSMISGGTGAELLSGTTGSYYGTSVSGVGDLNGDGYSDFAVGAPGLNAGKGGVKIYYGAKTGIGSSSVINGITGDDGFGEEVRGLGDINGDGYSDILVGSAIDSAKIILGGTTPVTRTINMAPYDYTITGGGSAGDFNGDGYDDMTIALSDATGTKIYVVYGKDGFNGFSDLNYLQNSANAFEMSYVGSGLDDLEISSIGDFNGDGYDDIAIGVPDVNGTHAGNGGLIIVEGRNTGSTRDISTATVSGQSIVGTAGANVMSDGGFDNVSIRAGAGNDTLNLSDGHFNRIDGGTGYDTIRFAGAGNDTLDFRNFNFEDIQSIERLQYGADGQTMTLSVENLFNLLKSSDGGVLKIDTTLLGNALNIDATGTYSGSANDKIVSALNEMGNNAIMQGTSDTAGYTQFKIGGYDLYIDADLTVNVV